MLTPERQQLLTELVESGTPTRRIQKKHGFNYKTIRKYFPDYRAGVNHDTETRQKLHEAQEVVEQLVNEQAPGVVIAQAVGVHPHTLQKHRPDLMWTKQEAAEFAAMVSKLSRVKEF